MLLLLVSLGLLIPPRGPTIINRRAPPVTACATSNLDGASADRLEAGSAIEVWHQGTLAVGNFRGRAEGSKNALEVELSCGNRIKIDGGQIVDVWAAGDDTPKTPADWVIVREQASSLLTELPPHMLDLRPLWQRLLTEKAGSKKRVDSDRVARDLFRSPHEEANNGRQPPRNGRNKRTAAASPLAQRLAAAQLLAEESTLFKRLPVEVSKSSDSDEAKVEVLRWSKGGFRALPRATASSRAEMALIEAMKNRLAAGGSSNATAEKGSGSVWPTATLPLLAEVELVALGLSSVRKQIERVLSAFDQPTNSTGARSLLLAVGQWNEGEEEESANLAYSNGAWLDPFPKEALAEGAIAATQTTNRRMELARTASPKPAKGSDAAKSKPWWLTHPGQQEIVANEECPPSDEDCISLDGRVDLRGRCSRVFAIDNDATDFRDDAISYDAATATLAVHICDMTSVVPAGSLLDDVARLRLQTIYSGAMPLHMLPPPLLRECALSPNKPNECLSALLQLDAFGRVRHSRLVRSIIPPVRVLSFDEVDTLLSDRSIMSDVHKDLQGLAAVTRRRAESRSNSGGAGASPFAAAIAASDKQSTIRWKHSATDGSWRPMVVPRGQSNTLVDEALAMFSYAARGTARRHNLLRLPQTENHRIATAPLRRYADLIAQRQLTAALQGQPGMPASEVAAVERWIRQKQSDMASQQRSQPSSQLLRALEAHCARQATATGSGFAVLDATVTKPLVGGGRGGGGRGGRGGGGRGGGRGGRGGAESGGGHFEVRLASGGVVARASVRTPAQQRMAKKLQLGQPLRVRLRSVDTRRGTVDVEPLLEGRA